MELLKYFTGRETQYVYTRMTPETEWVWYIGDVHGKRAL